MLARLKRVWQLLGYFIGAKKIWQWPARSKVLIFDAVGQDALLEYFHPWKPELLHVRGEKINIPVLFASLLRNGKKPDAYIDCFIEKVQPCLIVTFIQNSFNFYSISKRNLSAKTLFIQNGVQSYYCDVIEILDKKKMPRSTLKVDYMLTFGSVSGALYAQYMEGFVMPIGSLKNNSAPKRQKTNAGTIAFVSQYRSAKGLVLDSKYYTYQECFKQPDQIVLSFLARYASAKNKRLFIIPCSRSSDGKPLEEETRYYNELLNQTCAFSQGKGTLAGYDAADSAEVVVTIDSALGYESAARGKKTAIFSIRTQLLGVAGLTFGWPGNYPDEGSFWTNRPDAAVFGRILDQLFDMDEDQWQAELRVHNFADIITYDPGNSFLKSVLQKELGDPPSRQIDFKIKCS
jgi:surface carbohydrate biosynthesis protein